MKRIITCSDGTWNDTEHEDETTNVFKIYNYISLTGKDVKGNAVQQFKFYDKGVGATHRRGTRIFEGVTGAGLDQNIKDAYSFIMNHYEEGDEIYLFGFSRGAYTARSTAGFIGNCGLLKNGYWHKLDEAFEYYRNRTDSTMPSSDKMKQFKANFCYESRIKMVGVWDTVGSLGIPLTLFQRWNHKRYSFHDVELSKKIDFAYHALAIQERRNTFTPTLWEKCPDEESNPLFPQVLEQVWFCGVHSNVGGGYKDAGLSNVALKWMMCKAQKAGLGFKIEPMYMPDINGKLYKSASWYYKILGIGWRSICAKENSYEKIHKSVASRKEEELPPAIRKIYNKHMLEIEDELSEA